MTFYPLIRDRVLRTIDYDCKFLPDKNPGFVIAMAFVGHHVPCVVIVVCYAVVFYEIRKLIKTRPQSLALISYTRPHVLASLVYLCSLALYLKTSVSFIQLYSSASRRYLNIWTLFCAYFGLETQLNLVSVRPQDSILTS